MEEKIARHSLTIAQAIKLSTSTHTLILFIYPQSGIGVSINGCGKYCVVEAETYSTCNELAINILLHLPFVIFLLNDPPPPPPCLIEPPALIELNFGSQAKFD